MAMRLAARAHLSLCCYCREYLKQMRMIAKAFRGTDSCIVDKSTQVIWQRDPKVHKGHYDPD